MIRNKKWQFLLFLFSVSSANAEIRSGSLYELPAKFQSTSGETVSLSKWKGTPIVITMTYTSCQSACPRITEKMKNVQKYFNSKGRKAQFIIGTFDPSRDTPKRLKTHQDAIGDLAKEWSLLSGTDSAMRQLSMVLGIRYEKNPETGNISHDNKILITNDKGEIVQELNGLNADVSEIK